MKSFRKVGKQLKCPECDENCVCDGKRLKDDGKLNTDWYGILHFWICECCGTRFVSQNGGPLETAAIQKHRCEKCGHVD
jgi:hypothetical protein